MFHRDVYHREATPPARLRARSAARASVSRVLFTVIIQRRKDRRLGHVADQLDEA